MGLFSKLFKTGETAPEPEPARTPDAYGDLVRLAGHERLSVVGESNYQPALAAAAGGAIAQGDFKKAIRVRALLVSETDNRYDSNAVRVDVDGRTVGYLAREDAERYQPVLRSLRAQGRTGWCSGRIMGGGDRNYGIFLHIAQPDQLLCANLAEDLEVLDADRSVTVVGEEHHQDHLRNVLDGKDCVSVFCSFDSCTIPKGKYAGERTIEVRIDGERVGELTKAMADRYVPIVDAVTASGRRPGCEAIVSETDRGAQVELRMPQG